MANLIRYMIVFFIAIVWAVRIAITLSAQYGEEFLGMTPYNFTGEVVVLFLTLLAMVLIIRKNVFGPVIMLVSNLWYHGTYFLGDAKEITQNYTLISSDVQTNMIFGLGIVTLAIASCFEWLVTKNKEKFFSDPKRDWFFANDELDKEVDDRQDSNHYRI